MGTEAETTANSVIAQALENAGVRPANIELPSGTETEQAATPSLDGSPKGQTRGQELEVEDDSTPATKTPSEPTPDESTEQPLTKAEIQSAITEASSKFQSIMDKKINALNAQMQGTITALNQFFQAQENPDISGLSPEDQIQKRLDRLEKPTTPKIQIQSQPISEQPAQFYQQLVGFVDAVGLKVDDKRIDWAPDTDNAQTGFNRFLVSIKAAIVEDQTKVIQELKKNGDKVLTKVRRKTGVDEVSTTGPSGAGLPDTSKMTAIEKIQYGFDQQEEAAQAVK